MNINNLKLELKNLNQPGFRVKQIIDGVFKFSNISFDSINNLPKSLKEGLKDFPVLSFEVSEILESKVDMQDNLASTFKALLEMSDGKIIETVIIRNLDKTYTACISSQVGCAVNCQFCATGQNGFKRNLTSEEITDQILFWNAYLKNKNSKVSHIVYMGMGEPFLNYENLKLSLAEFIDPDFFNLSSRNISVSTSFSSSNILNLFNEFPQVNLAISLHFATDEKRVKYMPINNKFNLDDIRKFLDKYFKVHNRKVFLEYIMLESINDTFDDAVELTEYIKSIENNYLLHVNLIRYHSTYKNFKTSSRESISIFENYLKKNGVSVTLRRSFGEDINGACGQLAGELTEENKLINKY